MKLFYSPGACSLSPHIALREAGIPFTLVRVDLKNKKVESGEDFNGVNGKGYVPALQLDNGQILTEGSQPSCSTSPIRSPPQVSLPPSAR